MEHIPLAEFGDFFQSLQRPGRRAVMTALVKRFQPSDYRDMASICYPQVYVGDLVQILPPEIVDIIFAYCEPQEIFKFRNVSAIWNNYLSQPEFLQRMNHKMYAIGGQYLLDSDIIQGQRRSFEECVRHRCALLNGRACRFEHVQYAKYIGYDTLFSEGTLIQWSQKSRYIYAKRLYRDDVEWDVLGGDKLENFRLATVTTRHILACRLSGEVYCWDLASLDMVAHFWLTSVPELVDGPSTSDQEDDFLDVEILDATSDTIILVSENVWYLYSLNRQTLTKVGTFRYEISPRFEYGLLADQDGYFYVYDAYGPILDVLKIDATNSSISFVRQIDLNELGCQQLGDDYWTGVEAESSTDAFEVVIVTDNGHLCGTNSNDGREDIQELVFEMKAGIVTYRHTIKHQKFISGAIIYHPQMHMAFALQKNQNLRTPVSLDQIMDNTYRPCQSKLRTRHDIKTAPEANLPEEGFENLRLGLQANKDHEYSILGDGNFVILKLGPFMKVWRFYGTDKDEAIADH